MKHGSANRIKLQLFIARASYPFLQNQAGRYVFKFNGANIVRSRNYIGQLDNSSDMIALLKMYAGTALPDELPDFLLMQYLQGVEVGIGAYFNGRNFLDGV